MSKVVKGIGKIFKKVVKAVIKIAPYALAAAAVIFTGGAALGILPTFAGAIGGVVSGLGLSAGLTGALTGAITSAGFGGALGFITGGTKGLKKGALMGALTGGALGALSPSTFGIVKTLDAAGNTVVTTTNALAHGGNAFGAAGKGLNTVVKGADGLYSAVPKGISGGGMAPTIPGGTGDLNTAAVKASYQAPGTVQTTPIPASTNTMQVGGTVAPVSGGGMAATAAPTVAAPAAPAVAGAEGGGMMGFLNKNPALAGNLLQSVGGMFGGGEEGYGDAAKAKMKLGRWAYDGAYDGDDPFGTRDTTYAVPKTRYYWDDSSKQIVDRQQQGNG